MKMWWMAGLGMMVTIASAAPATEAPDVVGVKGADGKTIGQIVTCSSCQSGGAPSKKCPRGVENGWLGGKRCGQCLIEANYGARFAYSADLHLAGKLTDAQGTPLNDRFVKLFMANGWNVRTKTFEEGKFRMMLGATAEPKESNPLVVDVGERIDSQENEAYYALFFLPDSYKPCPATADKPAKKK